MADKPEKGRRATPADGALASSDLVPGDDACARSSSTDDLTISVPENLSIVVDLPPAPAPEVPEDEVAVAIDDVPVNPGFVASPTEPTTMSVAIVASRLATGPTDGDPRTTSHARHPAAARRATPFSQSRRDRLRGEHSQQPEPAAMLTADRLLEVNRKTRPGPEGGWHALRLRDHLPHA